MFKKILYPIDFSDATQKALQFVKKLKEAGTEEVVVLHVIDERPIHSLKRYTTQFSDVSFVLQDIKEKVLQAIDPIEEELKELGLKVKIRIEHGIPFSWILQVEEEENVSLIVIGSHGSSNIASMLLGSVSEKVIRKSKKPVIVIKRENGGF